MISKDIYFFFRIAISLWVCLVADTWWMITAHELQNTDCNLDAWICMSLTRVGGR